MMSDCAGLDKTAGVEIPMEECDVAIIGAGHNGLVCAAYLAATGLSVRVYERRGVVGGAAVTEEFAPGFRNSVAAYTVSLLSPKVIADLDLHAHGLKIVERRALNFLPLPDGRHLLAGPGRTKQAVATFSAMDAAALDAFNAELDIVADVLRAEILRAPPNLVQGSVRQVGAEALRALALGNRLRGLDHKGRIAVYDLFTKSAGDLLDSWFESEPIKALYGFDAVVGNYASPYTPGSAYVLLHHAFGEVNGKKGLWGHAIGGMGAITQAMARAAQSRRRRISARTPACAKCSSRKAARAASFWRTANASTRAPWSPTSIRNCCSRSSCRRTPCRPTSCAA